MQPICEFKMSIYPLITPSLHPDNIKHLQGYDEETASYVHIAAQALSEAYEGINDIHKAREASKRNPVWNEAAQLIQTDDFATKKLLKITKSIDSANVNLSKSIAHIEKELTTPLTAGANDPVANEIRSHVKNMNNSKRRKFIEEAQQKKDLQTLQALLGAPSYLSGLTDIEVQHYTRQLHEIQNPALAKRLKVMKNAATLLGERGGLVFREVEKAVGKPSHVIQKLRKAKNEAEQAFILNDQRVDL